MNAGTKTASLSNSGQSRAVVACNTHDGHFYSQLRHVFPSKTQLFLRLGRTTLCQCNNKNGSHTWKHRKHLEQAEQALSAVCHQLQQLVEAFAFGGLAVWSAQGESEEVEQRADHQRTVTFELWKTSSKLEIYP